MQKSIFEKIIAREIPAQIIHETDELLAFRDINPQTPAHFLVIPKQRFDRLAEVPADRDALLGRLLLAAAEVARKEGLAGTGYRVVINNGADGGETVPHLHLHVLGGRPLGWPPG
ncbi:MAG: histidine triad nucleotide-binding protein [Verrucomicrobiales bacterium]|jgi:histidine triad (HIT) family protein|nr:histidine triad nucleotide-binding protein [Verrucomicrobiales bacterium]